MNDSYITITSERMNQLVADAIARVNKYTDEGIVNSLITVEKAMRTRRWWNLVGPWYTSVGPPTDDQIYLWTRQTVRGSGYWGLYRRADWEYDRKRHLQKLNKYLEAAKDGDPFLLTLSTYNELVGI